MAWMFAMDLLLLLHFPRCSASEENIILQEPALITAEEGGTVNITCHFKHQNILGMYLRRKFIKDMVVLYVTGQGKNKTVGAEYKGRIEYFEQQNITTIILQQLQENDSGNYTCDGAVLINQEPKLMKGCGTILVVTAKKRTKCSSSSWVLYILITETLLLAAALVYFILSHVDAKKYCQKEKGNEAQNMVYEDMSFSLRHDTVANQYEC